MLKMGPQGIALTMDTTWFDTLPEVIYAVASQHMGNRFLIAKTSCDNHHAISLIFDCRLDEIEPLNTAHKKPNKSSSQPTNWSSSVCV